MSLDKALAASQSEIPECVAAGYVDMVTGMLLGVRTVDSLQDIYVGALTFLLFPFGLILPQTVVVEGNRQPTTVPDTGGQ